MNAIVAALPRELAGLVRGSRPDPTLRRAGVWLYRQPGRVLVCAGMGTERVTLAVKAAREAGEVSALISTGLAGGCDPALAPGAVLEATTIIDALSSARWGAGPGPVLVTSHTIAGVKEKQRLHASYGAAAVDMEAAAVARLAELHGLGFRAIKAISDGHDFELESLSRFASVRGHFRTGAFALHTALRPARWKHAVRLGRGSQRALHALTARLEAL